MAIGTPPSPLLPPPSPLPPPSLLVTGFLFFFYFFRVTYEVWLALDFFFIVQTAGNR